MRIVTVTDTLDNRGNETNGVYVSRALSGLGHDVVRMAHGRLDAAAVAAADFILAFGTLVYPDNLPEAAAIARDKRPDAPFALWYFDACAPEFPHSRGKFERIKAVLRYLDWLVATDASYAWESRGVKFLHLMQGVEPKNFAYPVAPPEPRHWDVIFTGGVADWFVERKWWLAVLSERYKVAKFGRGLPSRVYGKAFFDAYQRARVAFVPLPPKEVPGPYWSNRVYLATATGTPCVVGYAPGLEKHFEHGREVLFFRNKNELIGAVDRLLADESLRASMGEAARERTLREHTYERRCERLLGAVFGEAAG